MKKLFVLLTVVVLSMSLVACGDENYIIGTWEMDVIVVGETSAESNSTAFITFKDNGKCTYVYYVDDSEPDTTEFDYTIEDKQLKMCFDDRELVCDYVVKGDFMTLTYNGNTQILTRVKEG